MELHVGTDIIEISRVENLLSKRRFMARVFSEREREYITGKGRGAAQTAAGIFAAKEAFGKAVGTGISPGMLGRVEILCDERGKPYIMLDGELSEKYAGTAFTVSISHCEHYAVATVLSCRI